MPNGTDLKPLRGKTPPLCADPEVAAPDVLKEAVQKMRTFNKDMQEGPFVSRLLRGGACAWVRKAIQIGSIKRN